LQLERSSAILPDHPAHPYSDGLLHIYGPLYGPHLSSLFLIRSLIVSRTALAAENLALRQQLAVLNRKIHRLQLHRVPAVSPRKKIFALWPWRSFLPGIGSARSPPMKNSDDIPTTDTTEIKQLINRVKQGELDQGDTLLIEKRKSSTGSVSI
jgi:hypothetical protein